MRDLRNELMQEIKIKLIDLLSESNYETILSILYSIIDNYELSERSTALVCVDDSNTKLIKMYMSCLLIDGKSEGTIQVYVREIKKFLKFINNKDLTTICTFDLRRYIAAEKVRGISNRTLENMRANLRAFFEWMTREGLIQSNPCAAINPIKYTEEIRLPFSPVELDKLRSTCKNERERAIIEVLLSSGVRVSEFVDLNIEDIDFNKKSVRVQHGKGDKERYAYIDDIAKDHLVKYLLSIKNESGPLFRSTRTKGRYTAHGIRELLKKLGQRANINNVHPHRFRRTFATTLARRGMSIQEIQKLMGHANINTTMVYIKLDDSSLNYSYNKYIV